MAAGAGYYSAAVIATVLVLVSLWPLRLLAHRALVRVRPEEGRLLVQLPAGRSAAPILEKLEQIGARIDSLQLEDEGTSRNVLVVVHGPRQQTAAMVERLHELEGVQRVEWTA
jgi:uncharacterized membrane protein YhiD involved in acid resistance